LKQLDKFGFQCLLQTGFVCERCAYMRAERGAN
jgi:hypothetical protein